MSTERIYGKWEDVMSDKSDTPAWLWGRLAAQTGSPNSGLTQRRAEFTELCQLFQRVNPQTVLEIGTAQGGSFAAWCQLANKNATLISIDRCIDDCRPRPGDPIHRDIYSGPLRMSSQGGGVYHLGNHGQAILAINGWSHERLTVDRLTAALSGRKIDFLFHDASHSAEMFAKDFGIYWPMVTEGGVFACHDIMPSQHPDCNKSEEWERIKKEENYSALYEWRGPADADSLGIGVLIK